MNRLFGSKAATPKPSLTDAIASTETRADGVTQKIKKLDQELARYRDQMKKMTSGPGKVRERWDDRCTSSQCIHARTDDAIPLCRKRSNSVRCVFCGRNGCTKDSWISCISNRTIWNRPR